MLINLVFGLFYLNVINDFELGYNVARNLTAYQYYDSTSELIYLAPGGSNMLGTWGITYLPFVSNPDLDYCMNASSIPPRSSDAGGPFGLTTVTVYDVPRYANLVAVAPYVDERCANAFADQATADRAKVLMFINDRNVNDSTLLAAPSGSGMLSYSMISTSVSTGTNILYSMVKYRSNSTTAIPGVSGLNNTISRIGVEFLSQSGMGLSRLWVSILAVLAGILVFFIFVSILLNLIQLRRRRDLRRRIVNGEVNLELMGVSRLTVPPYILNSLPICTYKYGEMHFLTEEERIAGSKHTAAAADGAAVDNPADGGGGSSSSSGAGNPRASGESGGADDKSRSWNTVLHETPGSEDSESADFRGTAHLSTPLDSQPTLAGDSYDDDDDEDVESKDGADDKAHARAAPGPVAAAETGATTSASQQLPQKPPAASLIIDDGSSNNNNGAAASSSSGHRLRIKKRRPEQEERSYSQMSCPICLEDFVDGEGDIRELPCRHIYHKDCIDPFLRTRSSLCPLCKVSVLPPGYIPRDLKLTTATIRRERVMARRQGQAGAGAADLESGSAEETRPGFWSRMFRSRHGANQSEGNGPDAVPMNDLPQLRPPRQQQHSRRLRADLNDIPPANTHARDEPSLSLFGMMFRRLFPQS